MATTIEIQNFGPGNIKDVFVLDADAIIGTTIWTLRSNAGVTVGDILIFGTLGVEGSENLTVTAVNVDGIHITTGASQYLHKRFEPVTDIYGTTIRIYRVAVPGDNSLPNVAAFGVYYAPVTIDLDELSTLYTDVSGGQGFWYGFTYYNGTTETNLSDSIFTRGGGWGNYCTVDDIRHASGFTNNPNITNSAIAQKQAQAQSHVNSMLYGVYTIPFAIPVPDDIARVVIELAAGYLLLDEYGPMAAGSNKDGQARVDAAEEELLGIKDRSITLVGLTGQSLVLTQSVTSWPNASTAALDTTDPNNASLAPGDHLFRISDRY